MSTILEYEFEEPNFRPYGFTPELGDCAEAVNKGVSKEGFKHKTAFRTAGRLKVRHAP